MIKENIREKLKTLPNSSGVYVMMDNDGEIIYVGKARVLKNRVRQYFNNAPKAVKVAAMVEKIADFRYIITQNEVDALLLENNLIKTHKPYYNILLKDDKAYPYIRIDMNEDFPRLELTRVLKPDGAKYFGPFMQGVSVKEVINLVNAVYPIRTCKKSLPSNRKQRPCLNHHLGLCLAPCVGKVSSESYKAMLVEVTEFLKGHFDKVRKLLKSKMEDSADRLDFESAITYRKHLEILDRLTPDTVTNLPKDLNAVVFSLCTRGDRCVVGTLSIQNGRMVGGDNHEITDFSDESVLSSFIVDFLENRDDITVIVEKKEDETILNAYFERQGKKIRAIAPQKGVKKKLLEMASRNADDFIDKLLGDKAEALKTDEALAEIGTALGIPPPSRMECYDISHVSGTLKVASMVVIEGGKKATSEYRRFRIRTVEGSDDFKCMQETLLRRIQKYKDKDLSFSKKPDLIVIDGGKGQLSSVKEIVDEMGFSVSLVGLAKKEELLFKSDESEPIVMSKKSAGLMMLQRLRDEAHRFAITYHRKLRADNMTKSILKEIDGIGDRKIDILYRTFKSVDKIECATIEQLETIKGITRKDAENIYLYFHES